ncbi:MAG: YrdB family protein [Dehalococcoidia bacterium]|nr:YrdB family protein [Dehalococcoidia bacterium]MCA9831764.1 YrdB family protein [Dehalococcoidia bacterium]MCB9485650.1 YrdB family protein [Thermoflexaceae bacterium]
MVNDPLNLSLRFLLELGALSSLGYWGWTAASGWLRPLLAAGLPVAAATLWGVFRVPGDASASGRAPVAVPGAVRLVLEAALFGGAAVALAAAGAVKAASVFGVLIVTHYAISYDRIRWLLGR